jgi:glyoxylase-like metal-dependent hydrolase (beta-lactamase superfamily II)
VSLVRLLIKPKTVWFFAVALFLGVIGALRAPAQEIHGANEDLEALQLRPNFYVIFGAGANIAVQTGPDGVVLVDAGSAQQAKSLLAAIKKVTDQPIRYIINTSADADHVGGNEQISKAGQSLTLADQPGPGGDFVAGTAGILAHENVLNRMSAPTGKQGAFPTGSWPTETFFQKEKPIYLNREGIKVIHQPEAHSDGDAIVFFRRSDVIMAGDIIDANHFPAIDFEKGGSIQGEIEALNHIVQLAIPSIPLIWEEGGTWVIPGHGRVFDQADVVEYRDMITIIRDVIQDMVNRGLTLEQIKQADPTHGYRGRYGADTGFWTTDMFVEAIYKSLTAEKRGKHASGAIK